MDISDWHTRFQQQAEWTRDLRTHLFNQHNLRSARHIIEIGCGTGALTAEFHDHSSAAVFGLDIDRERLLFASKHDSSTKYIQGDASCVPFITASFDLAFCHYLLLWTPWPLQILQEMKRITQPGGVVMALAEPDYGNRIDYPEGLTRIGKLQRSALISQGANPDIGRSIPKLFHQAGLVDVEVGILGSQWHTASVSHHWETEWQILRADLENNLSSTEWDHYLTLEQTARAQGDRVLYIPTFYAVGKVPTQTQK